MRYLSVSQDAKTIKGKKYGYLTGILYLLPAKSSGYNVCASATPGCIAACLNTAGRASIFPAILEARKRKTLELFANREAFIAGVCKDVEALVRKAKREGLTPCVRINGTSDLPWLALAVAAKFPDVQFYDYTKHRAPWTRTAPNYHLTFSFSGSNGADADAALAHGINVAVVFAVKKSKPLPTHHEIAGRVYQVVDGDLSDLRFNDARPVIVGLRAKGRAKQDTSGFVQIGMLER